MRRCLLPATQIRTFVGTETSSSAVAIPPSWPDELALATNVAEAFRPGRRDALICSQASQSINVARLRPTGDKRGRTPAVRTFARHPLPCSRRRRPFSTLATADIRDPLLPLLASYRRQSTGGRRQGYSVNFADCGRGDVHI